MKTNNYIYSQDQAAKYHRKIHDLSGQLEKLRSEMKFISDMDRWRYEEGVKAIGGGKKTHFSWLDASTAGMCLDYLGKLKARVQADRLGPLNYGIFGKLSMKISGSYRLYLILRRIISGIYGSWKFFWWYQRGGR